MHLPKLAGAYRGFLILAFFWFVAMFVERGVVGVEVFGVEVILCHAQSVGETVNVKYPVS